MNSLLLHRLIKVAPFAVTAFSILLMAYGFHGHAVHVYSNGDPGGPGEPNMRVISYGDPGGPGEPN